MRWIGKWLPLLRFRGSRDYWEKRYRLGGDSGAGSEGQSALYKAETLNAFVKSHDIADVIEFGCGDGRQLAIADYPQYIGIDISRNAVDRCRARFSGDAGKSFATLDEYSGGQADLAISIDVIFHLVEDSVYDQYLHRLFAAARRFVVIYSTDVAGVDVKTMRHVKHRPVTRDVAARFPEFEMMAESELSVGPPVEVNAGVSTRFFFYRRGN